jgi:hypothetical protein
LFLTAKNLRFQATPSLAASSILGHATPAAVEGILLPGRMNIRSYSKPSGDKLTADVVGRGLADREADDPKLSYGTLDPSAFKEDGGPSIAERINDELIAKKLVSFSEADNTRTPRHGAVGGWDQMRSRLIGKNGVPMIYCFSTCADSIRTIPTLQHDPNRAEDVNTESEDHAADEWRYIWNRSLCHRVRRAD